MTKCLQTAVNDGYSSQSAVFFPPGQYLGLYGFISRASWAQLRLVVHFVLQGGTLSLTP